MKDHDFDELLRAADHPVSLPPSFQLGVWRRIESRAAADSAPTITKLQPMVRRQVSPWMAGIGIAATVTLGLWLGAVTAPDANDGKLAYAESISPFATTHRK